MVFRPWMYLTFATLFAVCAGMSHYYKPGMVVCGVGVLLCLWMMRGAQKFYGRRW